MAQQGASLFIFGLPEKLESEDLFDLFELYGVVRTANVIKDPDSGQSKCYGFVSMARFRDAQLAISHLDGHACGYGKNLRIMFKRSRPADYTHEPPPAGQGSPAPIILET